MVAQSVDLNRLQIFKQVVVAGSFSKAAVLLHQPKSRISRNISSLERELGVQLIYRTTRQFRLTDAGKDLYARALSPLNELTQVLENVGTFSDELSGMVRVTAPEDLGVFLLGDVCRAFSEIHPKVQIELLLTTQVMDLVKESIDLAIRIGHLKDSSLRRRKFGRVKMGLYMSPTFRAQTPALKRLEDLEQTPFLAFSHLQTGRDRVKLTNGKQTQVVMVKTLFSTNNFLVLRAMTVQGTGVALLPKFLVSEDLRQGTLLPLFADWHTEDAPIQVVLPEQREPLPRVKGFMEFVTTQLAPYFS